MEPVQLERLELKKGDFTPIREPSGKEPTDTPNFPTKPSGVDFPPEDRRVTEGDDTLTPPIRKDATRSRPSDLPGTGEENRTVLE